MDDAKRNLKGSEKRDVFKRKHKDLNNRYYASDADLCLIDKYPPGVVAYIDYKGSGEPITFAEVILYNEWLKQAPVFIVEGRDPENGPFKIKRYLGGNWKPNPCETILETIEEISDWSCFAEWEGKLRNAYRSRNGWNGKLRNIPYEYKA